MNARFKQRMASLAAGLMALLTLFALSVNAPALAAPPPPPAGSGKITVVAAENFYGDVINQLGGDRVDVTTVLSNPDQDPHLFEANPAVARALTDAQLVIYNGAGYDAWIDRLLAASRAKRDKGDNGDKGATNGRGGRSEIVVAKLVDKRPGDNPHLWYLPATMPALAMAVHAELVRRDPAHRAQYDDRLATFMASLAPLNQRIAELHARYQGTAVTATEPVFGYMADALGLVMRNGRFQLSVMNDTEPAAADIAAFENDLRQRRVSALIYNAQTSDTLTNRLRQLAAANHVPVVPVTETQPAGVNFQNWMLDQLDALDHALQAAAAVK